MAAPHVDGGDAPAQTAHRPCSGRGEAPRAIVPILGAVGELDGDGELEATRAGEVRPTSAVRVRGRRPPSALLITTNA